MVVCLSLNQLLKLSAGKRHMSNKSLKRRQKVIVVYDSIAESFYPATGPRTKNYKCFVV